MKNPCGFTKDGICLDDDRECADCNLFKEKTTPKERYQTTFLIACPNCYGTDIKQWEERMATRNTDWFICKEPKCGHKFSFKKASYVGGYA